VVVADVVVVTVVTAVGVVSVVRVVDAPARELGDEEATVVSARTPLVMVLQPPMETTPSTRGIVIARADVHDRWIAGRP